MIFERSLIEEKLASEAYDQVNIRMAQGLTQVVGFRNKVRRGKPLAKARRAMAQHAPASGTRMMP
jgi:hypothetical protein